MGDEPTAECPPLAVIERLADAGEIAGQDREHIAACASCQARLATARRSNALIDELVAMYDEGQVDGPPPLADDAVEGYAHFEEIHRGGQGMVYKARQETTGRTVALKVLLGGVLATSHQRRRFEREIELVAGLSHPSIITIHESGLTRDGRLFFAMEYVDGPPLTEYAQHQRLGVRDRLALLAKVCRAVEHAHRHGVIHRDLKPANILVAADGEPKILDFGVARVTDSDIQVTTIRTNIGQLVGTVQYMSPEQAAGDPSRIDIRTDVYALGVIGYQLLCGQFPYRVERTLLHEALRAIREDEPSRLGSVDRSLRGEVSTIVAKALEKEPARRYQSAADLAADIERWLRDEPIAAHPPSTAYQLRKFARRHRSLVVGVAGIFLVLVAGLVVSAVLLARALAAEDESDAATAFMTEMLSMLNPAELGREILVEDILIEGSRRVDAELAGRPVITARLRYTFGIAFMRIARLDLAAAELEKALELQRRELGERNPASLITMNDLGAVYIRLGRLPEAEKVLERTLELRRTVLGDSQDTLTTMNNLGVVYLALQKMDKAEELYLQTLQMQRRTLGPEHRSTLHTANNLAILYQTTGRVDEAERLLTETLAIRERVLGPSDEGTLMSMNNLGVILRDKGELAEAERLFARAGEAALAAGDALSEGPARAGLFLARQGECLTLLGRHEEAEAVLVEARAVTTEQLGPDHARTRLVTSELVELYEAWGKPQEAAALRAVLERPEVQPTTTDPP